MGHLLHIVAVCIQNDNWNNWRTLFLTATNGNMWNGNCSDAKLRWDSDGAVVILNHYPVFIRQEWGEIVTG